MNKRKFMACAIGGVLIFSLAFNSKTIARFSKHLDPVSQTINAVSFDVETDNTLEDRSAYKPGEVISNDTITLKNDNNYDVEFIIELTSENINETQFMNYLNLTIIDGESTVEAIDNQYRIQVPKNTEKAVVAKVDWNTDENGEIDAAAIEGGAVKYTYDIVAKQIIASSNETTPAVEDNEDSSTSRYIKTFTTEQDITPWIGITESNPSLVRILDNNSMVVKKNGYTELSEYSKLNEGEMFKIKTKVQFTGSLNAEEGFVYSHMMSDDFSNKQNNYASLIYKKNGIIYVYADKISNSVSPRDYLSKATKTTETDFILINEFYKEGSYINCNMIIANKDGNMIKEESYRHIDNDSYKLYASLNDLIGSSGIRVKEIEMTKGLKSL